MLLGETRKMQNVAKKTLHLFHEKVATIKQLNQKISEYMIQVGIPCSEVAAFNVASESNLEEYEDCIVEIEDGLQQIAVSKSPQVKEDKPGTVQNQTAFRKHPTAATRSSKYFFLCLPLDVKPSIFPSKTSFSKPFSLTTCPKTFSCL